MIKDPFKSEGAVLLKIQKLNQYRDDCLNSDAINVRGLKWRIRADIKQLDEHKSLGYFIECNAGDDTGKLA
jgi:hypothetical protein